MLTLYLDGWTDESDISKVKIKGLTIINRFGQEQFLTWDNELISSTGTIDGDRLHGSKHMYHGKYTGLRTNGYLIEDSVRNKKHDIIWYYPFLVKEVCFGGGFPGYQFRIYQLSFKDVIKKTELDPGDERFWGIGETYDEYKGKSLMSLYAPEEEGLYQYPPF